MRRFFQRAVIVLVCVVIVSCEGCVVRPGGGGKVQGNGAAGRRAAPGQVRQSARDIPILYDVDVLVVGGTSGGVAAAAAAADNGATVFLAAERTYLGEDICGTYHLWLEPGETPTSELAQAIFAEPRNLPQLRNRILFEYEADLDSAARHKDTTPGSLLADGRWHSAPSQSVEYGGDVTITAETATEQVLRAIHAMVYQRDNDFEVANVTVHISADRETWREVGTVPNERLGQGSFENTAIDIVIPVGQAAKCVNVRFNKADSANRVLLGEIVLEPLGEDGGGGKQGRIPPSPMQVKTVLDKALLDAGVKFLYGCYLTDVLLDGDGELAGIIMANRSGRQAVKAKMIIDATPRATVARTAGAAFTLWPSGPQTFRRIVVGGAMRKGNGIKARKMPTPVCLGDGRSHEAIEYTLEIPMEDCSFAAFARAEQIARDKTWDAGQADAAEMLFCVPPDRIVGRTQLSSWPGAAGVDLGAFQPAQIDRLFVLGGCADLSRGDAEKLLRPLEFIAVGERIGVFAAGRATSIRTATSLHVKTRPRRAVTSGDIREDAKWMRAEQMALDHIRLGVTGVPVLGEYDVVVVGGGTGGAPAGIAAARQGAKTLVIEYLHELGGVGTVGLITKYYYGNRVGFTREIDEGLGALGGAAEANSGTGQAWSSVLKSEWYRRQLRDAGADIWYGTLGCGAFVDGKKVKGVVVATPQGRGVVLAQVVIDSTGSASIAACAGATCIYTSAAHVAVQGTGLPPREIGARYTNTDYTFIDDVDVIDVWRAFVTGREKFRSAYDLAQIVDTRERRQIVGDFFLSPLDIYMRRTYPDSVVLAHSNFDTHGFTIHPMFMLRPPDRKAIDTYVPYRCLLPAGLDNILVTGLGVSAHRDVMPVIRMQADIQNQGYAAGVAAAMAARRGVMVRDIDVRELQKHLVEKGNLQAAVLTHEDSFPLSAEQVQKAVETVVDDWQGIEAIFAEPRRSVPLLRRAYHAATSQEHKLLYAHVLGILHDPAGVDTLIEAVTSRPWDEGWKYTGMGQFGPSMSELDSLIIALGKTRSDKALLPILEKAAQLTAKHPLSHHRAVALALETLRRPQATTTLAALLDKPGMTGHAFTSIDVARANVQPSSTDTSTREPSLRELILARALYRCGDDQGKAKEILEQYARDVRGHYARHALAVLGERGR